MRVQARPVMDRIAWLIAALMLVQGLCAAFFVGDILDDGFAAGWALRLNFHLTMELVATITLVVAVILEGRLLVHMLRRQERMARNLRAASGALDELIEEYFRAWALTPAEADVARFSIQGFPIAEIARLRGSAEGTVKTQLNAIYRKAGVGGRGQLVSLLIEELMGRPLIDGEETPRHGESAPSVGRGAPAV